MSVDAAYALNPTSGVGSKEIIKITLESSDTADGGCMAFSLMLPESPSSTTPNEDGRKALDDPQLLTAVLKALFAPGCGVKKIAVADHTTLRIFMGDTDAEREVVARIVGASKSADYMVAYRNLTIAR